MRGDCNEDGRIDISDPVLILLSLLQNRNVVPPCLQACDTEDNGRLNITDAIFALSRLFLEPGGFAAPFPGCGPDPTVEDPQLGCDLSICSL